MKRTRAQKKAELLAHAEVVIEELLDWDEETERPFAARWSAWLKSLDDEVAYHCCHISFGFNPGAEVTGRITEDERALGALTVGFGRQSASFGGGVKGGEHHLDIIARSPTLVAGDKTLLEANVLNLELGFVAL